MEVYGNIFIKLEPIGVDCKQAVKLLADNLLNHHIYTTNDSYINSNNRLPIAVNANMEANNCNFNMEVNNRNSNMQVNNYAYKSLKIPFNKKLTKLIKECLKKRAFKGNNSKSNAIISIQYFILLLRVS